MNSRATAVFNGIARCVARSAPSSLHFKRQCERNVEQKVAVQAPQIKEGVKLPFKEHPGVDILVPTGMEDIVEAVQSGRVQQPTAEQVVREPQSPKETVKVSFVNVL